MRGMETGKTRVRHEVFTEIARLAYEGCDGNDYARRIEELPYKICPGDPERWARIKAACCLSVPLSAKDCA